VPLIERIRTAWIAQLERVGSTRAIGLMRIGIALLCWSRWADELMPLRNQSPWYWVLALSFYLSTTAMLIGFGTRVATAATALTLIWMVGGFGWMAGHEPWTHHHTHLLMLAAVWLAFTPCGRSFSFDRWLAVRRARAAGEVPPPETGPLWAVPLLSVQVSAVYFFSAIDKSTVRFLSGHHLEAIFTKFYTGSDPIELPGFTLFCLVSAWVVVVLEYVLPFALFVRAWHWFLVPLGMAFHLLLYVSIPVGTFSLTMCVLYLAYLHEDDVHAVVDTLVSR
jgi:hypothetical protein